MSGDGGGGSDGRCVTYGRTDQMSILPNKYIKANGNQVSHCQQRKLQIWEEGKSE